MPAHNYAAGAAAAAGAGLPQTPLPDKAAPKQKPQSLWQQATGLVKNLPSGIADTLVKNAKGMYNFTVGDAVNELQGKKPTWTADKNRSLFYNLGSAAHHYAPGASDMASGMKRTGGNLVDLASVPFGKQGLKTSHYGEAVKAGTILPTVIQDVGNLAIVAGPATKALTAGASAAEASAAAAEASGAANAAQLATRAARLGKVANVAEKVTNATNSIADAPARPYKMLLEGVANYGKAGGELLGKTEWGANKLAALEQYKQNRGMAADVREIDQNIGKRPAYEEAKFAKVAAKTTNKNFAELAKMAGVDQADLTHAYNLHQTGLGPVISQLEQIPDEVTREHAYNRVFGVEQKPSAGARALLSNPELMAQADEAFAPLRKRIDAQEQIKLTTESPARKTGMLSAEQTGDAPMQSALDRALHPLERERESLGKKIEAARKSYDKARTDVGPGYETRLPKRTSVIARKIGLDEGLGKFPGAKEFNPLKATEVPLPEGVAGWARLKPEEIAQHLSTLPPPAPGMTRLFRGGERMGVFNDQASWELPEAIQPGTAVEGAGRYFTPDPKQAMSYARMFDAGQGKVWYADVPTSEYESIKGLQNLSEAVRAARDNDVEAVVPDKYVTGRNDPEARASAEKLGKREEVLGRQMLRDAKSAGRLGELKGRKQAGVGRLGSKMDALLAKDWWNQVEQQNLRGAFESGDVRFAPGKYKPALLAAERLKSTGAELSLPLDAPTTMAGLQERGIFPKYVQGGYEDPNFAPGIGAPRSLQERTTFAEKAKKSGNVLKSGERVAEQLARDAVSLHQNRAIAEIKGKYVRTPAQLIGEEINQLQQGPMDRPTELRIQDLQDRLARGHDLSSYMAERGYKSIANKAESGVSADSEFVPHGVAKTYKAITEPQSRGALAKGWDKTTQAWKTLQLPLNPGWNVGNLVGNASMAVVRGGMDPGALIEYAKKAREVLSQEAQTGESILPARLHGTSGVADMVREGLNRDPKTAVGKIYDKTIGKVADAGYAANEAVDNTGRAAYYMWLRDKGIPEEQAVQQTLRVMGDFSNLSPMEQQIKRALPFYAWQRHTAQMAYDMATKHPYRAAVALDLANSGRGDPRDPANQARTDDPRTGMLGLGGNMFLPMANMNPFTNSVQSPFLSPSQLAGSLNPIIKGAAAMGLDVNLQRGRQNTRPGYGAKNLAAYGGDESVFGPLDASGKRKFGPMSLKEDARYLLGQGGAIGRGVLGLLEGDKVRYDTGVPMLKKGKPITSENGRLQSAYKPLGLPIPYTMNQQRIQDNAATAAKTYAKQMQAKKKAKKAKK